MTPDSPTLSPAPRRVSRLLPCLVLLFALSGWVVAIAALARKETSGWRSRPGAVVVFHIARTRPALLPGNAATDPAEFESYRQAQASLIRRRLTLSAVLKLPDVASLGVVKAQPDAVAWLEDGLRVSFESEFMRVELDGEPVEEIVTVLQAITKVYLADADTRDNGARRERLAKLEATNRAYTTEVERYHKRMDTIALALGSKNEQTLAVVDSLMKDALRSAMTELAVARDNLQLATLDSPAIVPDEPPAGGGLGTGSEPLSPFVSPVPDPGAPGPLPAPKAPGAGRVELLKKRAQLAEAKVADIQKSIARTNEYRIEIENLKSSIARTEKLSASLAEAIERIRIDLDAPPRVTLVDDPHPRRTR